ncbi:MAG: hypothetical protein JSW33_02605, partial [bacterium]
MPVSAWELREWSPGFAAFLISAKRSRLPEPFIGYHLKTGKDIPISRSSKIIGVIGGNQCSVEEYEIAFRVGKLLAQSGAILICGGRGGIMEAAC